MAGQHCLDHSGCVARITNLEDGMEKHDSSILASHKRIDGMKNWVIAGMTSLVLQLIVMVVGLSMLWVKAKGPQ